MPTRTLSPKISITLICTLLALAGMSREQSFAQTAPTSATAPAPNGVAIQPVTTSLNDASEILGAPQTPEEIVTRYLKVLAVLKYPPTTGVLIADFNPHSPALAAGCHPGDIITEFDLANITTEESLRTAVSQGIAEGQANDALPDYLLMRVRRVVAAPGNSPATKPPQTARITLRVPRGPLGITGLEVETALARPLNPAPTPRAAFALNWEKLPSVDPAPGQIQGHELWTRLYLGTQFYGYENVRLEKLGNTWAMALVSALVENHQVVGTQTCTLVFTPTDNRTAPGFTLNSLDLEDTLTGTRTTATKVGNTLRGIMDRLPPEPAHPKNIQQATVPIGQNSGLGVIPVFAIPLVASALPHEKNVVAPFAQFSESDLQTRLGFVFRTTGQQKITVNKQERSLWGVEVLHFGRVEQTFYFDDQSLLVQAQLTGLPGRGLRAVRVHNQEAAQEGVTLLRTPK